MKEKEKMDELQLNSGYRMPRLGLGTWALRGKRAEDSVYEAIQAGYRLIDTAACYRNEDSVGKGIRRAIEDGIASRDEIFVTSKLLPRQVTVPEQAIEDSLSALSVGYIDLMLVHQPGENEVEIYHAMERAAVGGKIRSLGISNFDTVEEYMRIKRESRTPPAVVQNENHPFHQNAALKEYVSQYGTVVESWAPFGGRGQTQRILENNVIRGIAEAHGRTAAQIVLRWHLQAGYIVIPGSGSPEHIRENYAIADFELTDDQMWRISGLNRQEDHPE